MALSMQPSHARDVEFISTPIDFESIIDLFMRFRLSEIILLHENISREQVRNRLIQFLSIQAGAKKVSAHSNNGTVKASVATSELPADSQEDVFTWDYDSLHFDNLRLK